VKAATGHWYGLFSESSDRTVLSSLQTPCTISPSTSNDTPVSPQRSSAPKKETPQENPDSVEPIRQAVDPPQERVDKRKVSASPCSLPLPGLQTLHKPYSVKWTRARLQDAKPERVTGILHAWIHPRRYQEATPEVIAKINCLEDNAAVSALEEMTNLPCVIGRKTHNCLDVPLTITTLDNQKLYNVQAFLDSGSTSSCIDEGFVCAKGLKTRKFPRAIPCYNADGLLNKTQQITNEVPLRIQIRMHLETISL
jgi:hypothetical protein